MFSTLTNLFPLILQINSPEVLENAIAIDISIFSVLLLFLSITAFRKTHLRITIYAIIIFALFAIQQLRDFLQILVINIKGL
jgi:hypothetical protein